MQHKSSRHNQLINKDILYEWQLLSKYNKHAEQSGFHSIALLDMKTQRADSVCESNEP
jgi:hypothetical protein